MPQRLLNLTRLLVLIQLLLLSPLNAHAAVAMLFTAEPPPMHQQQDSAQTQHAHHGAVDESMNTADEHSHDSCAVCLACNQCATIAAIFTHRFIPKLIQLPQQSSPRQPIIFVSPELRPPISS